MFNTMQSLKEFFNNDHTHKMSSQTFVEACDSVKPIPSIAFISLEQGGVTTLYRSKLIELLKHRINVSENDGELARLINQIQFVLNDIKTF